VAVAAISLSPLSCWQRRQHSLSLSLLAVALSLYSRRQR
jgi:hypothetical protein